MAILLEDKKRKYQRIRLNKREKQYLVKRGYSPVVSSNVSAIAKDGASLYVRFHGGATYEYPTSGRLYARMLTSTSKGKFVWVHLRRKNVPYSKVGSIPMKYDERITDRDLMEETEVKEFNAKRLRTKQRIEKLKTFENMNKQLYDKVKQIKAQTINTAIKTQVAKEVVKTTIRKSTLTKLALTTLATPSDMTTGIITALVVANILERSQQPTEK